MKGNYLHGGKSQKMKRTILVLEGGAMRSLYTSGVLDVLMENGIETDCTIGVSAGALVGSNYISKQKGRTAGINIDYCKNRRYIGIGAIKNNKGLVGFDYLFGEISKEKYPFDEKTFYASNKRFVVGATNCATGKTEYFEKWEKGESKQVGQAKDIYRLLQASSSMPLASNIVTIDGKDYLDGAIDCNIPIEWALEQGYEKIVVVLTREKSYHKEPVSDKMKKVYKIVYKQYPNLVQSLCDRPEKYNNTYQKIAELEKQERVMVFQPQTQVNVTRLERNQNKLKELYQFGMQDARQRLEELRQYLAVK